MNYDEFSNLLEKLRDRVSRGGTMTQQRPIPVDDSTDILGRIVDLEDQAEAHEKAGDTSVPDRLVKEARAIEKKIA